MDVDEAGVAPSTNEWMEAALWAADTDGILENEPCEAPEGVQLMQHAHSPAPANPAQKCTQKERVSPKSTRASRTIVRKKEERERAPKRAAPTHLRTPSQITPESLPWHCRGTAGARCARARCARRARQLPNDTPERDSNPGPRAGSPGRSPLGNPAGSSQRPVANHSAPTAAGSRRS